jgi:hypothetical protein
MADTPSSTNTRLRTKHTSARPSSGRCSTWRGVRHGRRKFFSVPPRRGTRLGDGFRARGPSDRRRLRRVLHRLLPRRPRRSTPAPAPSRTPCPSGFANLDAFLQAVVSYKSHGGINLTTLASANVTAGISGEICLALPQPTSSRPTSNTVVTNN